MKITKSQLVQIIKEEAVNFKKELELKNELAEIEKQLNEVHTTGKLGVKTDTAGHQHDVVFDKVKSVAGVSDTIKEDDAEGDIDQMEELMAAIKTIAKACGLTGSIELEDEIEMGDGEGDGEGEEDIETDVIEPDGEETEAEETEEEETESDEDSEEGAEEASEENFTLVNQEGSEDVKEEECGECNEKAATAEEEVKTLNESIEKKRMMQLAGLK